jgi:hypothetical protein
LIDLSSVSPSAPWDDDDDESVGEDDFELIINIEDNRLEGEHTYIFEYEERGKQVHEARLAGMHNTHVKGCVQPATTCHKKANKSARVGRELCKYPSSNNK